MASELKVTNTEGRISGFSKRLFILIVVLVAIPILWVATALHTVFIGNALIFVTNVFLVISVAVVVGFPSMCIFQRRESVRRMFPTGFWPLGMKYYTLITVAISLILVKFLYMRLAGSLLEGYPPVYIFYISFVVGIIIFIFLTALASNRMKERVVWYVGNFIKNNNCRWWTSAILFVNFVLICLMLTPTPGVSVEDAEGVANQVWGFQPLRDFFGFILWGNDGIGHKTTKPLFVVASESAVIGWWHVWTAIALGAFTLISMPFAYRDEVAVWVENLRATREAGKETKEEKPLQIAGASVARSVGAKGWQSLLNFGLLDMFWEALYLFAKKIFVR